MAYKIRETGEELDYFPADPALLESCEVVYHEMEGWQKDIRGAKTYVCIPIRAFTAVSFQGTSPRFPTPRLHPSFSPPRHDDT